MPPQPRTSDLTILIGAGVAMAILTVISFMVAPADTTPRVAGSSYSTRNNGGKAAYLLLKELGHDVQRSFEPVAALRVEPSHTILVLAHPAEGPSEQDTRAMARLIASGGTVLALGPAATTFLPSAPAGPPLRPRSTDVQTFDAVLPGPLTHAAPQVSARPVDAPRLDATYLPVYAANGVPAVMTARVGDGRIVLCLDATPVENEGINRSANARFLANVAGVPGAKRILWDEFYHGERRSLWSYVAGTPLAWGAAQTGIMALATLAAVSRRRGVARARFVEPRTSPLEFIETMAGLYERAGAAYAAVEAARTSVRRRLAAAAGLSPSADDRRLVATAASRTGVDGARAAEVLSTAADVLRRSPLREADAVRVVAALQALGVEAAAARAGQSGAVARWRRT